MRPELRDPVDRSKYDRLLPLVEAVFDLHEAGCDHAAELAQISRLLGRVVGRFEVLQAFGTVGPAAFAESLAIDWNSIPANIAESDLLEMLEAICEARGSEAILDYWMKCLRVATGDDRISDLIFWPEHYFGPGVTAQELSPAEMLRIALRQRHAG